MKLHITSPDTINTAAQTFVAHMDHRKVYAFDGNIGAGKTTFIKAICQELGVTDTVNSPTFAIVNEYETAKGYIIYHFDCYRLNRLQEAYDLGAEEYLHSGQICFIEWPENIEPLLPDNVRRVQIIVNDDNSRTVLLDD